MSLIIEHSTRLTQASTDAPTAVEVVNTLANDVTVAYARTGTGVYTITYAGLARFGVTAASVVIPETTQYGISGYNHKVTYEVAVGVANVVVTVKSYSAAVASPNTFSAADDILSTQPVTVRFVL